MKRMGMILATACAMLALLVPDWKGTLHAATGTYGTLLYRIDGANLEQRLKVAGCKPLKSTALTMVEFYDDGAYYYAATDGSPVRGEWALAKGVFYLTISDDAQRILFDTYNLAATIQCKEKYPDMTAVEIIEPSVITSKNVIKIKGEDRASGKLLMKGKQVNDGKKPDTVGNFSVKAKISGTVTEVDP